MAVRRVVRFLLILVMVVFHLWNWFVFGFLLTKPALCYTVFGVLQIMQVICLFRTGTTKHQQIPDQFCLSDEQLCKLGKSDDPQAVLREVAANLPVYRIGQNGIIRYCDKCKCIKPYQCHHCPLCDRCILELQFHQPLANACIGFSNYKFFLLFLLYSGLLHLVYTLSARDDYIREEMYLRVHEEPQNINIFIFWPSNVVLCALYLYTFLYHFYLIGRNKTAVEIWSLDRLCRRKPFSPDQPPIVVTHVGVKQSLRHVFGSSWLTAFLPIFTSEGDGTAFCPWVGPPWPMMTVLPSVDSIERGLGSSVPSAHTQ